MKEGSKFQLPSPVFSTKDDLAKKLLKPHFLTPQGMLLPSKFQPPPMFGPRGPTIPSKFLTPFKNTEQPPPIQENEQYWCEGCEREFHSKSHYEDHVKQHRECGIDGCNFFAGPATIEHHIRQQHCNGIFERIKNLDSEADVAKWREDRRKKYPTRANVELRQRAQEERHKRGERLQKPNHRFAKKVDCQKPQSKFDETKTRRRKKPMKPQQKESPTSSQTKVESSDEGEETKGNLRKFKGTASLDNYKTIDATLLVTGTSNALSSIFCSYGSSSEELSEEEENSASHDVRERINRLASTCVLSDETCDASLKQKAVGASQDEDKNKNQQTSEQNSAKTSSDEKFNEASSRNEAEMSDSEDMPEEMPIERRSEDPIPEEKPSLEQDKAKKRIRIRRKASKTAELSRTAKKSLLDYSKLRVGRQNTMLEKLLQPEIIHERNVLLQCVRFVVKNNFFDVKNT